ncbi:MAG: hypothetical protein GY811_22415 [Myxococcales bacterium]|nr:hypothetical protein [Myxococcales bacterium]
MTAEHMLLWAQAPALEIQLSSASERAVTQKLHNCMPTAELWIAQQRQSPSSQPSPTQCISELQLPAGKSSLLIAPPEWQDEEAFLFADMGDIQTAMDRVHEVFEAISQNPDLRFVMSTGDVVQTGAPAEYELFRKGGGAHLDIPFLSTVDNHELTEDTTRWR